MKKNLKTFAAICGLSLALSATAQEHTWAHVSAGDGSTYAIEKDGTLWVWGWNESGQLGLGSDGPERTAVPMQVGTDTDWVSTAGGKAFAFYIKNDGTLWAVGDNSKGCQGVGDGQGHKTPTQVGTDTNWKTVVPTRFFGYSVMGLKTDGTLWSWGEGESANLGHGNFKNVSTPTQVGTDTDWKQISVGSTHTLALKEDGTLWACGWNERGQLGEMDNFVKTFAQFGEDNDWAQVFAVDQASYAIKTDGTLWVWGYSDTNMFGLNDASITNVYVPTQVTAIEGKVQFISGCENVRVVGVGDEDGIATKVYAWGSNADGALGDGNGQSVDLENPPFSAIPVEVKLPEGTEVTSIASGQFYTVVLTKEGKLYAWGKNRGGQLGDFSALDQLTFSTLPILSGEKQAEGDGVFTFDSKSIPSSLASAKKLVLTGEWGTDDFVKLTAAIGNNAGFPPAGNTSITEVDMSQALIKEGTSLYVSYGTGQVGTFQGCRAIEKVLMPEAEQAANFVSLRSSFQNCSALKSIDLTGCVNITSLVDAFYGCESLGSVDISNSNLVTASESAFDKCMSMSSIVMPATITLGKFFFGDCTSLTSIDWSRFEGTEAPAMPSDFFQYINDLSVITLTVPEAAYESFATHNDWSKLNVVAAGGGDTEKKVYTFDAANIPASLADAQVIVLEGEWGTSDFALLTNALGNNAGFPAAGNGVLEEVDMSKASIAVATDLNVTAGLSTSGVFFGCRELVKVVMPEATAENFNNLSSAFKNCVKLAEIDLVNCTGLTNIAEMFYGCEALTVVDLSGANSITKTEYAFSGCASLAKITLPGVFPLQSKLFDACIAMAEIDWSRYEGTEAPAYVNSIFDDFSTVYENITLIVPEAAYESFAANDKWARFNLQKAENGVGTLQTTVVEDRKVYDLTGRYITTLCAGESIDNLPNGIYIVGGKKIFKTK